MGSYAMLMMLAQSLLLMPKVCALSALTEDGYRLHQHQDAAAVKATMDAAGKVKPHHHQAEHRSALMRSDATRDAVETSAMKRMYPYYHTTDELKAEALRLSKACGGAMNISTVKDGDVDIDVITVSKPNTKPSNKVFILFGEHSRELISPESGLYFLRSLCGDVKLDTEGTSGTDVLKDSEFQMVLNSNPRSRRKVEGGDYCLRTNPDGVDLNRNWDEDWQNEPATFGGDSSPGPKPFSEPETRIFRKLVTDYAPTTFLTVHSGTRGMYMPWAYDMQHLAKFNEPSMMEILKKLDKDHCECPYGAAGKEVGYPCPGTCLDYAYGKLNTPFVFAFEIYVNPVQDSELKERWDEKMKQGGEELLQKGHHLAHPHFHDFFDKHSSDFVHLASHPASFLEIGEETMEDQCFGTFNPPSQPEYDQVVKNWAQTYLQMSVLTAEKIRAGKVEKPQQSAPATPKVDVY